MNRGEESGTFQQQTLVFLSTMNEGKLKSQYLGIAKIDLKQMAQFGPSQIPFENNQFAPAQMDNEATENNYDQRQLGKRNIMQTTRELEPPIPNGNKINRESVYEIEKILETMEDANCCKIQKVLEKKNMDISLCSILRAIQYLGITYNHKLHESPPMVRSTKINAFPRKFPKQQHQYIFIGEKHFNLYRSKHKDANTIKIRVRWPQMFTFRVAINSKGIVYWKILVQAKKTIDDDLFCKFLDEIVINLNYRNNMNGSWLIMDEAKNPHINDEFLKKLDGKYELLFLPSLDAIDLFFHKIKILTRKMVADQCLVLTPEQLMEKCLEQMNASDFEMFVNSVLTKTTNEHCAKRQKTVLKESDQNL